ncbi:hypothetical protein ACWT_7954 [Actinoplanes sp. SE50]|nr:MULTISPECIES: hypothetical protein [unclassified Actinoplanes]AEV88963.1 hypothetical protein ACPL_8085 [Actinoplanes sp. SE50/110]ATO87369.1 hypothetical protein ACWT_7954 [Actinoplanes sp. SE50]SLM04787.1 hypothetical protein ACSP50_8095 [Actinoplanes sp. SE50/110]
MPGTQQRNDRRKSNLISGSDLSEINGLGLSETNGLALSGTDGLGLPGTDGRGLSRTDGLGLSGTRKVSHPDPHEPPRFRPSGSNLRPRTVKRHPRSQRIQRRPQPPGRHLRRRLPQPLRKPLLLPRISGAGRKRLQRGRRSIRRRHRLPVQSSSLPDPQSRIRHCCHLLSRA